MISSVMQVHKCESDKGICMKTMVEKLLEREAKYHLCEKEINEFQYWQYERFYVDKCMRQIDTANLDNNKVDVWKLLKYYLRNSDHFKKTEPIDICFISHPRRQFKDGYYECIYTDALAKKFPDSITFENFFARDHLEPILSTNVLYMDRPIIEAEIYERVMGFFKRKKSISETIYKELTVALKGLITEEQVAEVARRGAGDYYRYQYLRTKFKKILEKMKPKAVVEVVSYGPKCMIINELCKDMGIPTIELQHGWIGKEHIAYNYAPGSVVKQFPDKIYLFGEYYKTSADFPISQRNLIATGFPHYEREVQKYNNCKCRDLRCTVLFLSQGKYAPSLPQLAVDLRRMTKEEKVRIIYKLHPVEYSTWKQTTPQLMEKGIEVVDLKGMPLYECFANSDVQVGAYSTAIYEGLGFGLCTLLSMQDTGDYLQDLIEDGIAERIESAADIVKKIQHHEPIAYDIHYFWKGNALHNLEQELRMQLSHL